MTPIIRSLFWISYLLVKMKNIYIGCVAILLLLLQGCFIFGIKSHFKERNNSGYKKLYSRNHIKNQQELYLDTSFYKAMSQTYKNDKQALHDHLQPVQYLLFNRQGYLQSFMINCFVHTNLLLYGNWNYNHEFDTFPTHTQRPLNSLLTLQQFNGLIRDTSGRAIKFDTSYDYTEIVIFGSLFYRAGKELIQTVKHQNKNGYKVRTYYVNGDNQSLWRTKEAQKNTKKSKIITMSFH